MIDSSITAHCGVCKESDNVVGAIRLLASDDHMDVVWPDEGAVNTVVCIYVRRPRHHQADLASNMLPTQQLHRCGGYVVSLRIRGMWSEGNGGE